MSGKPRLASYRGIRLEDMSRDEALDALEHLAQRHFKLLSKDLAWRENLFVAGSPTGSARYHADALRQLANADCPGDYENPNVND